MKNALSAAQLATLRTALTSRASALRQEILEDLRKSDDDQSRLLADRVNDLEDESTADVILALDAADTDRDLQEWRDVAAALERVRLDSYGTCVDCGDAIPYQRLEAWPTAKRCIRCQKHYEQTHVQPGQPTL